MGAGGRSGPSGKAGPEGRQQGECERRFRHEHASDEQRVRHRDVVERRLTRGAHPTPNDGPREGPVFISGRLRSRPELS